MEKITSLLWAVAHLIDAAATKAVDAFKWISARALVIAKAAPTWLTAVTIAAPLIADQLAEVLPSPVSDKVTAVALTVGAVAASLITVIRRLTPVPGDQHGLLPGS